MTGKKYDIVFLNGLDGLCSIQDTKAKTPTFYNDLGHINAIKPLCDRLNKYDDDLRMCREKALYWRNKAENIFGDMKTNVELERENRGLIEQLNYIQDLIINTMEHQKTELQRKALQEIITNYNEWILGHNK